MKIAIQNIYYLLCYAWDALEERDLVSVSGIPGARAQELFATVLARGIESLLRRGLVREYDRVVEEGRAPRGRIDVSATVARALRSRATLAYAYDELRHDVLPNRILRSTLDRLLLLADLDRGVERKVAAVRRRLGEIAPTRLDPEIFRAVRIHRNSRDYRFLLDICQLVVDVTAVDDRDGSIEFRDFARDEDRMWRLFEGFARNFYHREAPAFRVRAQRFEWDAIDSYGGVPDWLPLLQTDIVLDPKARERRRVVVEVKFVAETMHSRYGAVRVDRSHLFQLHAYLRNLETTVPRERVSAGILLYARSDVDLDFEVRLAGHPVFVRTLDLSLPWQSIHDDLLRIVDRASSAT